MSAEVLRRAAGELRGDASLQDEDYGSFLDAVADWLGSVAVDVDKRDNPQRVGGRFGALRIPDEHAALAVGREYLGNSA